MVIVGRVTAAESKESLWTSVDFGCRDKEVEGLKNQAPIEIIKVGTEAPKEVKGLHSDHSNSPRGIMIRSIKTGRNLIYVSLELTWHKGEK